MGANNKICRTSRLAGAICVLLCIGCQPIVRPMPQPMPRPVPQPIGYPLPQPIGQTGSNPHPVGQPISYPQPVGQPTPQPSGSGLFFISGTAEQQATVKTALSRCTFPFERLKPGLRRSGLSSIKIIWQPMGNGTLGWASNGGEIGINNTISGLQAQRTTILELGHAVDFFYMTPEMRKAVTKLWHPDKPDNHKWFDSAQYWDRNGEAFSTLFLWAFADEEMWFDAGYSHKPSKELAIKLRAILLPESTP